MTSRVRLDHLARCGVLAVLPVLLVAAILPSWVGWRTRAGSARLQYVRAELASAMNAVHRRWMLREAGLREQEPGPGHDTETDARPLALSSDGWPTLDPRYPEQDTIEELIRSVLGRELPPSLWSCHTEPAEDAGSASCVLNLPGGGSFRYDAASGRVR